MIDYCYTSRTHKLIVVAIKSRTDQKEQLPNILSRAVYWSGLFVQGLLVLVGQKTI